jgi:RecB family exonuclease
MVGTRMSDEKPMIVNTLVRELSEICRDRLLDEKWVIAPSLRAGNDWLLAVARTGQPVVNGHVKTIANLALNLAAEPLAQDRRELITARQGSLLIDRVIRKLRKPVQGYLWRITPSVRLAETVYRAIDAMRRAGLGAGDMNAECFEVPEKGRELKEILRDYLAALDRRRWIDRAGVLRIAIERLRTDPAALEKGVVVLIPESIDVTGLERQLLDAVPAQRRIDLHVDHFGQSADDESMAESDARLLRHVRSPSALSAPKGDGSARLFRAVGEINEIREVLRRCLKDGVPLDQVEVLCTDVNTYVPLIYETFARVAPESATLDEIPVTLEGGIPARKSRPGRALVAWLSWIREDFPQPVLVQMIQEGLLEIPGNDPKTTPFARLAAVLRRLEIGFGRERYQSVLEKHLRAAERRTTDPAMIRDEDGQSDPRQRHRAEDRLVALRLLHGLFERLFKLVPAGLDEPARVLELAHAFLIERTRQDSKLDDFARKRLSASISEMRQFLIAEEDTISIDVYAWLAALPGETKVNAVGPRAGCLHVANVLSGGHSGRPHTFIVGLDDSRFPGARLQDPILLDEERRGLSPELRTSASDLAKRVEHVAGLFARLRGTVTLSYSCFNLMDDREMFPSSIVLSAFRILSGQRDGDQAALNQWLGPAASFAPNQVEKALTESEWWLWRMSEKAEVVDPLNLVAARYPHLGRGYELARMRRADEFTVFDGWIPRPGPELDLTSSAGPTVSASRLETLGQCPLKYFFRYVLDLEPPEELAIDPSVWLDPLARGSLLHEVFEHFLKELIKRGAIPDALRDEPRLMAILDERISHYRNEIPPPSEAVFRREQARLRRTARIFLREESEYCRETGNRPLYLEVAVGLEGGESGSELDTEEPVPVKLPDGSSLRVRGRIDRVDRVAGPAPNVFAVWDYKTGGTWKYTQEPRPFWAGRVVQHALYLFVMNARLAAITKEFPGARVERFGYFFPSEKASGERIEFTAEELEGGKEVLTRLAKIAANGAFLATTQADKDCGFCDYRGICGDVEAVAAASARKLREPTNTILAPYAELRTND